MTTHGADAHVATRDVGQVQVTVMRSAVLHWAPEFPAGQGWESPGVVKDERGRAVVDVLGMIVRTPAALIVVDPGAWSQDEQHDALDLIAGRPVDDALASLGLAPADVTHVVITHAHLDHVSGLVRGDGGEARPRFPNAEHLFPAADWNSLVLAEHGGTPAESVAPVERAGLLSLTAAAHEIDASVTVLPAPGESPGHQVVRVESGDERAYLLGDLFHFPIEFEHLGWAPTHAEAEQLELSRRRILEEAATAPSALVFAHGRFPGWGRAEPHGDGWRWQYL